MNDKGDPVFVSINQRSRATPLVAKRYIVFITVFQALFSEAEVGKHNKGIFQGQGMDYLLKL